MVRERVGEPDPPAGSPTNSLGCHRRHPTSPPRGTMAAESLSTLIFTGPLSWTDEAACAGRTELFFAPGRRAPRGAGGPREQGPRRSAPSARCSLACRDWAREHREYGFWGGESEEERAAAGFRVDMPVGRVARYPKGNGNPVAPRTPEGRVAPVALRGRSRPTAASVPARMGTSTPDGVDLERLRPYLRRARRRRARTSRCTADADRRRSLEPHVLRIRRHAARGCCGARRSATCCPTAHDMVREYRVMTALAGTGVPVPRTLALCEDLAVNDAPFYVMELVDGHHLPRRRRRSPALEPGRRPPASPRCSSTCSPAIHAVDYAAVGLGEFGRPDGFLERQVRRWGEQWERSKTRELPEVDELARRLRAALPDVRTAHDRARRLPPRQHDDGDRRPGPDRRGARLGDVDARRSARRPRAVPPLLGTRRRPGHRDRRGDRDASPASCHATRSSSATRA